MEYVVINNKRVLAIIPARGGSKGIKDKNIYPLCGKPLIAYSIEAAKRSVFVDEVLVSTDSAIIADVAKKYGASVPFLRPTELASDTAKSIDAIVHAIETLRKEGKVFDILILLQPTSPLRITEDIDGSLSTFVRKSYKSLVSISEVNDNPILIRTIDNDGELRRLLNTDSSVRRQDMEKYYRVNGSIYINLMSEININTSFNDNIIPYIIPQERAVDIDELKDLAVAEYYITRGE